MVNGAGSPFNQGSDQKAEEPSMHTGEPHKAVNANADSPRRFQDMTQAQIREFLACAHPLEEFEYKSWHYEAVAQHLTAKGALPAASVLRRIPLDCTPSPTYDELMEVARFSKMMTEVVTGRTSANALSKNFDLIAHGEIVTKVGTWEECLLQAGLHVDSEELKGYLNIGKV